MISTSDSLQLFHWRQLSSVFLLLFIFGALCGQTLDENFARLRAAQMFCDGLLAMTSIRAPWALVGRFFATFDIAMETQCPLARIRSLAGTRVGGNAIVKNYGTISTFPILDRMNYWKTKRKKKNKWFIMRKSGYLNDKTKKFLWSPTKTIHKGILIATRKYLFVLMLCLYLIHCLFGLYVSDRILVILFFLRNSLHSVQTIHGSLNPISMIRHYKTKSITHCSISVVVTPALLVNRFVVLFDAVLMFWQIVARAALVFGRQTAF